MGLQDIPSLRGVTEKLRHHSNESDTLPQCPPQVKTRGAVQMQESRRSYLKHHAELPASGEQAELCEVSS